jgi:large subunit ribosomal protein L29
MKGSEVRERTTDELNDLLSELRRQIWQARFDNHSNTLDDTSKVKRLRRDLARVKTILTERAAQAQE